MTSNSNNPYVGPRTFTRQESDRFFGREREARELFSLVVSERLVLFYAQSGAGKSSLLNTRLIPQLQAAGFAVLPPGRVSGELPPGMAEVGNIFAFNLMLSLDQSNSDPQQFAHLPLTDFLAGLVSDDGEHYRYESEATLKGAGAQAEAEGYVPVPHVLIIDQFEEITTTHPRHWPQREDFFRQLDRAMADDPLLWAVLTFREDYLAALEPYAPLLAGNMRARFYMQRMECDAALEAVKKPAQQGGRPFAPGVAESLVDNLRQIRVEDQTRPQLGQFVEPVQLQVVCYQLWENLKTRPAGEITQADLQELGNVDRALADFYEQALAKAIAATEQSELELRDWFERKLITEAGTRGSVYRGKDSAGGIPTRTTDFLVNQFVLRSESRAGGIWYELVHDRFIEPILQANKAWRAQQPLLVQMAEAWISSGESMSNLLEGQQLQEALRTNRPDIQRLGFVKKFIEASQTAQQAKEAAQQAEKLQQAQTLAEAAHRRAEAEAKAARRLRWIIAALAVTLAVLLGLVGVAVYAFVQRQEVIISHEAITTLLSLDGRLYISVAPDDRTVKLVDTANREVILTLTGHTAEISKITLSPNANYLATADHGGTTIIWDLNTGQAIARLAGHSDTIRYMVFSHDGRWVATGGDDGTTRLWDTSTWQQTHVFNSGGASIISVAFWPDDSFLVTATTDKKYTIWDPQTGEKVLDGNQ
ncbi:MAG: hypothetical protein BroJett011_64530 [Chloroflexota bacterium]|nr:MAG: hypothetical protein BroJett011_64530 [Chloroflexota bacterium]